MTPDFALSLSFEGIRLLHRGPGGWSPVGEVPLDSRDLTGDLAALRRAGLALGVPWQGTKLLLPEEQIRTLALDDPHAGPEAARAALDGTTPYAVEDLVIDQVSDGTRTHVAAVARETLEEAFAFAAEHGFQPVSFAARPGDAFPGEAFFGPTRIAASVLTGETVTRETPPGAAARAEEPEDDTPQINRAPKAAPMAAVPQDAPPAAEPDSAPPEPSPAPDIEAAAPLATPMGPENAPTTPDATPAAAPTVTAPQSSPPQASPPPRAGTPLSAGVRPDPSRTRAVQGESRAPVAPPANAMGEARRPRVEPRIGQPSASPETARRATPVVSTSSAAPSRREPSVAVQAAPMAATTSAEALAATLQAPRRDDATTPARAAFSLGRKGAALAPVGGKPRYLGLVLTAVLLVIMATVAVFAAVSDRSLASLFQRGSAPATEVAETPSAVALPEPEDVALAVPPAEQATEPATAPRPDVGAAAAAVAAALAEMPERPEAPDNALAATDVLVEDPGLATQPEDGPTPETALAPEATGIAQPAPLPTLAALAPDAPLATPEPPPAPRAEEPASQAPSLASTEAPTDQPPTPATVAPAEAPPAFADAAPAAEAPDLAAGLPADQPLTIASAEPAVPTGVEVVAGRPPVVPPTRPAVATAPAWVNAMAEAPGKVPHLRPQDLVPPTVAAASPAAATAAPGGLPLQPAAPEDLLAALAPGADPLPGATGLTDPALEGALAFAPAAQPASPAVAPGGVSLAGLRPNARPEDLAPAEEAPPEEELAAWDGPRPGLRPEGLAPEAAPSPEVDDAVAQALETPDAPAEAPPVPDAAPQQPNVETALAAIVANSPDPLAGATRQAVPQARVPASRPANFGRVVATQLDRLARANAPRQAPAIAPPSAQGAIAGNLAANEQAESAPEVASSAAAAPSGPTAASVAQAATFQDAIALREINLIGVYGQPNARHALVRMGNGRYLRVGVGDSLDGGQVTAIGDNALNYVKRGRTYALVIPGG